MQVGFIGLGNVGAKLANSVLRGGFALTVHDLEVAAATQLLAGGASWAGSAADVSAASDVVITCLPSPAACDAVMHGDHGVLAGIRHGAVWIEMSTTDAAQVGRAAEHVVALGADAADCPVSGGCHRAASGNIAIFAGCDRAVFERVLPLLATMGRSILHTGPIGSASVLKVVTNYLASAHLVALGEALVTAQLAGADLGVAYEAIRVSSGNSFVHETEGQLILNGSRDIGFTLDLARKDTALFTDLADRHGIDLDLAPALTAVFADAIDRYGPQEWSTNVVRRLEDATGTALRAIGFPAQLIDDEPAAPGRELVARPPTPATTEGGTAMQDNIAAQNGTSENVSTAANVSALIRASVRIDRTNLSLHDARGERRFHHVWLRDNCWCHECRVAQTGERQLFTASIPTDITAASADVDAAGSLHVTWNDGHRSTFVAAWLDRHDYSDSARALRRHEPTLWDATFSLPSFAHAEVVGDPATQLAYLDALRDTGVAIVHGVPSVPGQVETFAEAIGHVREVAFDRVHDVRHDPTGYNVSHTPAELKPHTDMPSYAWPPSIQLLHFLVNAATGGESVVVDGWRVLADLRRDDPDAFDTLVQVPVPFQLCSDDEDTFAVAPMIQLDTDGRVTLFRFSNQLALPLDVPFDRVEPFYAAYRTLGAMVDNPRYRVVFKSADGDLLTVHGHRVLHGRMPYDPASGARHLQDVYMEFDDLMARRRVLRAEHLPLPANVLAVTP